MRIMLSRYKVCIFRLLFQVGAPITASLKQCLIMYSSLIEPVNVDFFSLISIKTRTMIMTTPVAIKIKLLVFPKAINNDAKTIFN